MRPRHRFLLHLAAVALLGCTPRMDGQISSESLTQLVQELPAYAADRQSEAAIALAERMGSDPVPEVKAALPALVGLTESADEPTRQHALLALMGLTGRQKPGLPENRRQIDTDAVALLVPYIAQLAPRLNDPAQPTREVCLLVLGGIATVRPTPRALLGVLLAALRDPHSTTPLGGAPPGKNIGEQHSMGPQILWIMLPAGATFSFNSETHLTEGQDSAEVQAAVVQFLKRPDQTPESLSESFRAITMAQPQNNLEMNDQLVNLLDSPSVPAQLAILSNLPRLRLSPQIYEEARQRVEQIADDPTATAQVRSYAKQLLACWTIDGHRACIVPCGSNCAQTP